MIEEMIKSMDRMILMCIDQGSGEGGIRFTSCILH